MTWTELTFGICKGNGEAWGKGMESEMFYHITTLRTCHRHPVYRHKNLGREHLEVWVLSRRTDVRT